MSGAAFAALAGLIASGALTGLDQWACNHLMPFAQPPGSPPTPLDSFIPLYHADWHPLGAAVAQIVTLPGQVVVSFVLVAFVAWRLRAPEWIGVWLVTTGLETLCKHVLTRPALYRGGIHATAFDASWPSGHALRCALAAAVLATAWPRARAALVAWLAAAAVLLELAGFHTPTDVAGGLLLALAGVAVARRLGGGRFRGLGRGLGRGRARSRGLARRET